MYSNKGEEKKRPGFGEEARKGARRKREGGQNVEYNYFILKSHIRETLTFSTSADNSFVTKTNKKVLIQNTSLFLRLYASDAGCG